MKEIEVKILEIDKGKVLKKINELGAKKVFEGELVAVFYDFADSRLTKEGKRLRVRQKASRVEMTLKSNITKKIVKLADEYKIELDSLEELNHILSEIGLKEILRFKKHRSSWHLNQIAFEIDTFPGLPPLLEIEAPDLQTIQKYVKIFGYEMKDTKPWSAVEVCQHYGLKLKG